MVLDANGTEVDWYVGYRPPGEKVQEKLQAILDGTDTFKSLSAAYAKNPKDVATVFKLARKYNTREEAKALEKFKEVVALDPAGRTGTYTQDYYNVTVPYTEYAEFAIAANSLDQARGGQKPDMGPAKAFMAKYPQSRLIKQVYERLESYYGYQATKEDAARFYEEYTAKYPDDPMVLFSWLSRIVRDKGPVDQGITLAARIEQLTEFSPDPGINQLLAQAYALKGDKAKVDELYGKTFMENKVTSLAYSLVAYANYWLDQNANQESALAMAEKALLLVPDSYYLTQQVASAYIKAGNEKQALSLYGPAYARKIGADSTSLFTYAGFWARQGKNLDDALAAAKKSIELLPRFYLFWSTLSLVYEKMKNFPEAINAKEKAVELGPEAVKASYKKDLDRLKAAQEKK